MNIQSDDIRELQGRLTLLEKHNRRCKRIGAAALIVVTSLFVMAQAPAKKTVEANEFILRDSRGNVRVRLSVDVDTPEIAFFDERGAQELTLGSSKLGGLITIFDQKGLPSMMLMSKLLMFTGELGKNSTAYLGPGRLRISDDAGYAATLGTEDLVKPKTGETNKTSAASLVLLDKEGNVIWRAP